MQTPTQNSSLQVKKKYIVGASTFWYVGLEPDPNNVPEHIFLSGNSECISERCIPEGRTRVEGDLVTDITGGYLTVYLRPLKQILRANPSYSRVVLRASNKHFQRRLSQLRELEEIANEGVPVEASAQ